MRRPPNAAFHAAPANDEGANGTDPGYDDDNDEPVAPAPRAQRTQMYSLLTQKARELVEKWSGVPFVASRLFAHLNSFDEEWGDPESYRVEGAPSSRPTPSRGSF